jgi:transposase
MNEQTYETERLDHLGIVAGICNEVGLIEQVDACVGPTERKVSVGEAVQAMVINALGFVGRPLYLTPEFFANKPVDLLIREGLEPEELNDDSLGRALDRLYETGVTEAFAQVASHALGTFGIEHRFYHLDSTTFSLHGDYSQDEAAPEAIEITHGYSRDHRPDLKQSVLSLICSYRSRLPVWLEALSGNQADNASFPETIKAYVEQLEAGEETYFIADSALYSKQNIQDLSQVRWITRVPATLKAVKILYQTLEPEYMQPAVQEGYRVTKLCSTYGGVRQRWVVVFSEAAYEREKKRLQRKVSEEHEEADKALRRLEGREFETIEEAEKTADELTEAWAYHDLEFQLEPVPHYGHRGRPRKGEEPERVGWRVTRGDVVEDEEAIQRKRKTKGKFILATNELSGNELPAAKMLTAYKGQSVSVERGFRFLKDPIFFADGLFLEKPERIMALLMVMGLALLIYALAERKLRKQLAAQDECIPDQKRQPTQRPTMRRVFQMFEGIDVLLISTPAGTERQVLNLKPVHHKILKLLGFYAQKCYLIDI